MTNVITGTDVSVAGSTPVINTIIGTGALCMAVFFLWLSLQHPFPEWGRNWIHKKLHLPPMLDRIGAVLGALIGFAIAAVALAGSWSLR